MNPPNCCLNDLCRIASRCRSIIIFICFRALILNCRIIAIYFFLTFFLYSLLRCALHFTSWAVIRFAICFHHKKHTAKSHERRFRNHRFGKMDIQNIQKSNNKPFPLYPHNPSFPFYPEYRTKRISAVHTASHSTFHFYHRAPHSFRFYPNYSVYNTIKMRPGSIQRVQGME